MPSPTWLILDLAEEVLASAAPEELPMSSGEILRRIRERGAVLDGRSASVNLSAKLGRDTRFFSPGRAAGWHLTSRAPTARARRVHHLLT